MIRGFEGTPGSGKTYEAVKIVLDNLRLGRVVFTNIDGLDHPNCLEATKNYCGLSDFAIVRLLKHLPPEEAQEFWNHIEPGSLVVIDEAHKLFNNRDWNKQSNRDFTNWCSTHRHQGFDLILITQNMEKIDSHARTLLEWTYRFKKINFLGSLVSNSYICFTYSGDEASGQPLSKNTRRYNQRVFKCYQSYATDDAKEVGFMKQANILKHPVFLAIPLVLAFTLYMFFSKSSFATGDIFGSKKVMNRIADQQKEETKKVNKPGLSSINTETTLNPETTSQTDIISSSEQRSQDMHIYRWTDKNGVSHDSNNRDSIPPHATVIRLL